MATMVSDTNTRKAERAILRAARAVLGGRGLEAVWEHGHWWVQRRTTGAQWDVCDEGVPGARDGFYFERVTDGDEDY